MIEAPEIITIDGGMVNAYLLRSGERFVLVDTLTRGKRELIERELETAGCSKGTLALIVVTHGDPDHTGNCAYLRERYGAKIGMHSLEVPAAETGDMRTTRGNIRGISKVLFGVLGAFFRPRREDLFTPDVLLDDGDDLSAYGIGAKVLHLPGHSLGSISVLTADGDLICGDLMTNRTRPEENWLVDDPAQLHASVVLAGELGARRVFPGHGRPFEMSELTAGGVAVRPTR